MSEPVFFARQGPFSVAQIAEWTGAELRGGDGADEIFDVAPLDAAGRGDLAFLDNPRYAAQLATTAASACLVAPKFADRAPSGLAVLVTPEPYRAFAMVSARLYPQAVEPTPLFGGAGVSPRAHVHASARIEEGATIEPGATVGAEARIGRGTVVAPGAVIGRAVTIGRDCVIGANATVLFACLGNRVTIHPGAHIGQDGFGFAMGPGGHLKVPQVGRVIIQDDVEIGANTSIDRGANRDTIVGEGTKIDNLVQIGHNVVIGRHCVIVSLTGISGSVQLGDFVVLAAKVGVAGHLKIGDGAQIAASSNVIGDVPPGVRWGGSPARPVREWFREMTATRKLAQEYMRKAGGAVPDGD